MNRGDKPRMRKILVIGIGVGDPDQLTVQAVQALNRVDVFFVMDKGPAKTTVTVSHERLPDPDEAEAAKVAWRQRLGSLKAYLEA